jgi:cytochrome c5
LPALADDAIDGRQVYVEACAECHDTGKAWAPLIGDTSWAWRAKGGMDKLMIKVRYGSPGMPAKGGCTFCTDDELIAATQYILDNSPSD